MTREPKKRVFLYVSCKHTLSLFTHLSLPIRLGQTHLPEHLRPLLHHQRPLVRVRADVAVVLKDQSNLNNLIQDQLLK